MYILTIGLLIFYGFLVLLMTSYCFLQLHLLYYYRKTPQAETPLSVGLEEDSLPHVTIQLPIFNEKYVIKRLMEQITKMDYPKHLLQIQILDDSTDDTLDLSEKLCVEYNALGFDMELIHRTDRSGYKAGALDNGLTTATGEFVAIFDADFLPEPNFLMKTVQYFNDPKVGVVQTRWTHINEDYSLLTRLQAFQLNVHFTVEQRGRQEGKLFLQFNGTAGIWRKEAIEKSGGWNADTITEDLDLSYRAQLKGYRVQYLENVPSPAELPVEMSSLKSQQFRWMKGGAEVARKILPVIWKSKDISLRQKLHATGHLMNSSVFLIILTTGILSLPLMFLLRAQNISIPYLSVGFLGFFAILFVYYEANVKAAIEKHHWLKSLYKFLLMFPVFLALSMGLSLHNTIAVIQGYLGKKTAFIRTPKFNIQSKSEAWEKNKYLVNSFSPLTIMEGILGLIFAASFINGIINMDYGFLYIHFLFAFGFLGIFIYSIRHSRFHA